jgi:hypothetical protein
MTHTQKRRFLRELTRSILDSALDSAEKMPEEWDGHELRCYLADKFRDSAYFGAMGKGSMRRREYENHMMTSNF